MTRVLMLSTDANIFDENSDVRERMKWYGTVFDELHIVVCAAGGQKSKISENVFGYPTRSRSKIFCLWGAYNLSKQILQTTNHKLPTTNWVITSQDPFELGLIGYTLKRRFSIPLQLQVHTDFFSPYFWRESLKNKIRVLFARFLLPRADGIRVVSERIKHSLISNLQIPISKIAALPIFVEIEKIRMLTITTDLHQKYPQFDFIILMASRLTREKNIGMAIKAFAETKNTLLLIVGDGPEKENLKLLTIHYNLQSNIIFEPAVDFPTLVSYYKTVDLFLLTSNYEGYGRTVIEAMAVGCPVIMTDVGIAGEIVIDQKNGLVVPVGDVLALAQALFILYKNETLRKTFIDVKIGTAHDNMLHDKTRYIRDYHNAITKLAH